MTIWFFYQHRVFFRRTCRHAARIRLSEGFMARVFESTHLYSPFSPKHRIAESCRLTRMSRRRFSPAATGLMDRVVRFV
jgi:hypothetical protein